MNDYYAEVLQRWPDNPARRPDRSRWTSNDRPCSTVLFTSKASKAVKLEMTNSLGLCRRPPDFKLTNPDFTSLWKAINRARLSDHPRPGADDQPLLQPMSCATRFSSTTRTCAGSSPIWASRKTGCCADPLSKLPRASQFLLARHSMCWLDLSRCLITCRKATIHSRASTPSCAGRRSVRPDRLLWGTERRVLLWMPRTSKCWM